ncbi:MAG: hydrogenase subunit MbhD domain-containing protein [Oscillospiraceae bacterium]
MVIFEVILLVFLIVCAISVSLTKNLFTSVIVFMSYSLVMSLLWLLLRSPDLAITEAAVGAGVTSILFFITLKNVKQLKEEDEKDDE